MCNPTNKGLLIIKRTKQNILERIYLAVGIDHHHILRGVLAVRMDFVSSFIVMLLYSLSA